MGSGDRRRGKAVRMATSRTHAYPATTRAYPARARHYSTATPAGPQRASLAPAPSTVAPTLRFLGLLLLLTPLLGGVNMLVHPPAPLPPEVITQIVEVTRPVYVAVPVPTVVVVEVPVARGPAVATTSDIADAST